MVAGDIVNAAAHKHHAPASVLGGGAIKQKSILDMKATLSHFHIPSTEELSNTLTSVSGQVSGFYNKTVKPSANTALKYAQENPSDTVLYFGLAGVSSGFATCFLFCVMVYACIMAAVIFGFISVAVAVLSIALIVTWAMLFVAVSAAMCVYVPLLVYRGVNAGLVSETYDTGKKFIVEDLTKAVISTRDSAMKLVNRK